ncbi:hypothetical protein JOE21_002064 [Desmospora profundinema]|uniref:Uncharacterized protein n=1 Tax=Desmospora profundinema TaxID=1571184 RepID=A0ABU1IMU2_9BACL|nr:hypothetical protein [Desmospora profundinema]
MAGGEPLRFLQRNEDSHTDRDLALRIVQTRLNKYMRDQEQMRPGRDFV